MIPQSCPLCGSIAFPINNSDIQVCTGSSCGHRCRIGTTKQEALAEIERERLRRERLRKEREEEQISVDNHLVRNSLAGFNAGWERNGNTLLIYVPNMNADYGPSSTGKSIKVANREDMMDYGLQFTLNVYRPHNSMDRSTSENARVSVIRGGRINIEILDIHEDLGPSSTGKTNLVAHVQESIGDVIVQLTVYRY